jgi:23S rRNA (cytidine1920-2'-O)/16S rRNA (cytidine1409-2'-O)-methyltransferase
MRLDEYMVEKGLVSSRVKAKRAVANGMVLVNGAMKGKASYLVKRDDIITLVDEKIADMPYGYYKLREIQKQKKIISGKDVVLDLGSSAGGYLLFASEVAKKVYGIEFSPDFELRLKRIEREHKNVKVFIANVFTADFSEFLEGEVSIILNDLTLNWMGSMDALSKALPSLKKGGKALMTIKLGGEKRKMLEPVVGKFLGAQGLKVVEFFELENHKDEFYLIAKKV